MKWKLNKQPQPGKHAELSGSMGDFALRQGLHFNMGPMKIDGKRNESDDYGNIQFSLLKLIEFYS